RVGVDRLAVVPDGVRITAGRRLDSGDPCEPVRVSRILKQGLAVFPVGLLRTTGVEIEIAQEDASVGAVVRYRPAGLDRLLHRLDGARHVAEQVWRIPHPRGGAEGGREVDHLVDAAARPWR